MTTGKSPDVAWPPWTTAAASTASLQELTNEKKNLPLVAGLRKEAQEALFNHLLSFPIGGKTV